MLPGNGACVCCLFRSVRAEGSPQAHVVFVRVGFPPVPHRFPPTLSPRQKAAGSMIIKKQSRELIEDGGDKLNEKLLCGHYRVFRSNRQHD